MTLSKGNRVPYFVFRKCPGLKCQGLTLVEIMIALLIMSIGILGLAGMQSLSLSFNTSAAHRTQATALASGLVDRMRANRAAALAGAYDGAFENPAPACAAPNAVGTIAQQDISAWRSELACRVPQSTGSVAFNAANNEVTIIVQWDDSQGRNPPVDFLFVTVL